MDRFKILKNSDAVPCYSPVKPSEPEYFPGKSFVSPSTIVNISEEDLNSFRELWNQVSTDQYFRVIRQPHTPQP
jgi:hypothetical protein